MKIYHWSIRDHGYYEAFDNEQELIEFLGNNYSRFLGEWEDLNSNWNDKRRCEDFAGNVWYELRNDIFIRDDWSVVNVRGYEQEAKKIHDQNALRSYKARKHVVMPEYGEVLHKWKWGNDKGLYKFRCGPVPGIGHGHGGHWLRHPHTTREKRQNADPEAMPYVRPARRPRLLPSVYDDIPRSHQRSWKTHKKRHQWEKCR